MNKPDDLILLGSMPIPDAHIVKGVLDEYGIPSEILTSSLKKHAFYNLLINNILYLCVT